MLKYLLPLSDSGVTAKSPQRRNQFLLVKNRISPPRRGVVSGFPIKCCSPDGCTRLQYVRGMMEWRGHVYVMTSEAWVWGVCDLISEVMRGRVVEYDERVGRDKTKANWWVCDDERGMTKWGKVFAMHLFKFHSVRFMMYYRVSLFRSLWFLCVGLFPCSSSHSEFPSSTSSDPPSFPSGYFNISRWGPPVGKCLSPRTHTAPMMFPSGLYCICSLLNLYTMASSL